MTGPGPAAYHCPRRTLIAGAARLAPALLVATLAGCGRGDQRVRPVPIDASDNCARCGMMISDLREAAEIVAGRRVWKFDDLGEMFAFHREHDLGHGVVRGMFVHEFTTRSWLPARGATYVVTDRLRTDMGFGVAAFGDAGTARRYAGSTSGAVRSFDSLLAAPPYPSPSAERMST